jgi:hypothetical protein
MASELAKVVRGNQGKISIDLTPRELRIRFLANGKW